MDSVFRVVLWFVVSTLVTASLFPLFGYELVISQLEIRKIIEVPTDFSYLLVVRSSSFATLSLLRHELPKTQAPYLQLNLYWFIACARFLDRGRCFLVVRLTVGRSFAH